MLSPEALIAPPSVGTLIPVTSADREAAWERLRGVSPGAAVTLPTAFVVQSVQGVRPVASPFWTALVFGSYSRKMIGPVAGSPVVAIVSTYSVDPGTCWTDEVSMAVIASCFDPRCPSPKFVNETAIVATTGITWKAMRKIVPGTMYLIGMWRGWR